MSKVLTRLAATDPRFESYSDETGHSRWGDSDGHWLYCSPGWVNPMTETHMIHEYTVREVLAQVSGIVRCDCDDCQKELAK